MGGAGGGYTFSQVPSAQIPRSSFDRSFNHKTAFNADYLIPVFADEVLPGDTFQVDAHLFARMTTPIKPLMDNLYLDSFWFFVPNRLLWTNWQKMMGEQDNPGDSISFITPVVTCPAPGWASESLFDYLGLPVSIPRFDARGDAVAFWSRAYNLIWNEWFRDENLQNKVTVDKGDGPDNAANYVLLKRGKRHDYFTACLPWPQKAATPVQVPLGTTANVIKTGTGIPTFDTTGTVSNKPIKVVSGTSGDRNVVINATGTDGSVLDLKWNTTNLVADLSTATAATINSLRQAFQIQKLLERDARGGTRYIELLKAHFGVTSPDARLQRPEYLGGSSQPISINPVVQTSGTGLTGQAYAQGNLAAYGVASARSGFSKSFVEHGVLLGLVCVRADLTYQQGMHKMFSRSTRYDYYWPAFANLGEQAVLNQEIYFSGNANDGSIFGYQERWAEYRYKPGQISGKLRSQYATPLDIWHAAEKFTSLPVLGSTFIQQNTPMSRLVAVTTEPHFYFDSYFRMKTTRPMPTYSVPGLIDHF